MSNSMFWGSVMVASAASVFLLNSGADPIGCRPDGDGGAFVINDNYEETRVRQVEFSKDGKHCILADSPPILVPVMK